MAVAGNGKKLNCFWQVQEKLSRGRARGGHGGNEIGCSVGTTPSTGKPLKEIRFLGGQASTTHLRPRVRKAARAQVRGAGTGQGARAGQASLPRGQKWISRAAAGIHQQYRASLGRTEKPRDGPWARTGSYTRALRAARSQPHRCTRKAGAGQGAEPKKYRSKAARRERKDHFQGHGGFCSQ